MAQFEAFDPQVEVIGRSVQIVIDTMGLFERMAREIFEKHGIVDVTDDGWYSQQAYLDVYREIYEKVGPNTMKMVGRQVPERALWPPDIATVEEALRSMDAAYHMNHRGGEIGHYRYEKTGNRIARMVCHNPYPCPFDEGIIEAAIIKFAPRGARVSVTHDEEHGCRLRGDESCTYDVSW
ncbi:MAG: hypothetical protein GY856_27795 [bacterium]|nr:hypothetical protein [bacterium]